MILLIGARFGGKAVPEALSRLDLGKLKNLSSSNWVLEDAKALSITQLEVLRAIELKQPVFVFVDDRVMHDHLVYEKNKQKSILGEITFPSIEKPESAPYIFEFINYFRLRNAGNALTTFARIDDIESHLRKQWSGLFQRLLREERARTADIERARHIQQQLDELKTAILSTIQAPEAREIARSVIRFRSLIEFASGLRIVNRQELMLADSLSWARLMEAAGIVRIAHLQQRSLGPFGRTFLLQLDDNYVAVRMPLGMLTELCEDATSFAKLALKVREATLEAWTETYLHGPGRLMQGRGTFTQFLDQREQSLTVEFYDALDLSKQPDIREFPAASPPPKEPDDDEIPF
jgi:hypothetical protein